MISDYVKLTEMISQGKTVVRAVALEQEAQQRSQILRQRGDCPDNLLPYLAVDTNGRVNLAVEAGVHETPQGLYYLEQLAPQAELIVLGAGHVAQAVQAMASLLDFAITVIDPRAEFANANKLPCTDTIICKEYEPALRGLPYNSNAYFVITTPGHLADRTCAELILPQDSAYVGMIGSKIKVASTKKALSEAGISEEQLAKLHAPIGLPIGGQTPAEIAISILAQVIQVRSQRQCQSLDSAIFGALQTLKGSAVMVTIVTKRGSGPRGVGTRMIVTDSSQIATVGGGSVEYACIHKARTLLKSGEQYAMRHYDLSGRESAELGMICGGSVDVIFELIKL